MINDAYAHDSKRVRSRWYECTFTTVQLFHHGETLINQAPGIQGRGISREKRNLVFSKSDAAQDLSDL